MTFPLSGSRTPRADHPGRSASLNMADNQQSPSGRIADRHKATFVAGMIGIPKGRGQRIVECRHSLIERHAVFPDVRWALWGCPTRSASYHLSVSRPRCAFNASFSGGAEQREVPAAAS